METISFKIKGKNAEKKIRKAPTNFIPVKKPVSRQKKKKEQLFANTFEHNFLKQLQKSM